MKTVINIVYAITLIGVVNAHAQTCNENVAPTNPVERFIDNGDGTVSDKHTGLIWMRCSLGQAWDGATCTGGASEYTWQQALQAAEGYTFAGSSAWRMPNRKQLQSIVERSCYDPAINLTVFPQTPDVDGKYWTSSPDTIDDITNSAWIVSFKYGNNYKKGSISLQGQVRLVRSGGN